jgi:2-keto-4-pentenoate hydratase
MNRQDHLRELAARLAEAEEARLAIGPLTDDMTDISVEEAYQVQQINARKRISAGDPLVGHKIGLTAKVMQEYFGVDQPDYGQLFKSMFIEDGSTLDLSELVDPQIEVEPAFVLSKPLQGPGLTVEDVIDATDYVTTCFEVIDSRVRDWKIKLQDTIADNGSSARVVLGLQRFNPSEVDLANLVSTLRLDGKVVAQGNTSAILGHPAAGVAWLANALAGHGMRLEMGHVVLPGTATVSHRIAGFTNAEAEIETLGKVRLTLSGGPTELKQ